MNEITVRPKYSRQTATQRRKRGEFDNDLLSTALAVKLLVVVVFLSVFALCKAANTPATNYFISKVKVITTSNYDVNKYIMNIAKTFGISLPQGGIKIENESDGNGLISESKDNINAIEKESELGQSIPNHSTDVENKNTDTGNVGDTTQIQSLDDLQIKAMADKYSFIVPIKGNISSSFGTRTDPLSGISEFHSGLDIEANMGASIKAALAGEVIEVGSKPEYGNYIKIQHNDGINTVYAYCSILIAKKGQKVNQGDVIAKVGDAEGLSSSLHFEVWKDNKAVDPEKLLNYLNQ